MSNILIIAIPILLILSFLWALWSLQKELKKESYKGLHELKKEEPVVLTG